MGLSYIARPLDEIKEATKEERLCALEAAEAIQINLNSSNPSFIKSMVRSHVYSCFWLVGCSFLYDLHVLNLLLALFVIINVTQVILPVILFYLILLGSSF